MKPFSKWTAEEIEEEFHLTSALELPTLRNWLTVSRAMTAAEEETLRHLSEKLQRHVHDWNEEELKVFFVALLLDMVDFYQEQYRPFMEREFSVEYAEGKRLWGVIDFLVAHGKQTPKQPFFFIHEHKKQAESSNDPLGQLLAEMVAAQKMNARVFPIYGAYIVGRHWYFVVLENETYAESLAYDATKDEIFDIFEILRHAKDIIETIFKQA